MTTALSLDTSARTGRARVQSPASGLTIVLSLTRNALVSFVREPLSLVFGLLYPVFLLILMDAFLSGGASPGGVSYGQFLSPAMITVGVMTTCLQTLAVTVAGERESGELRRLAVLPTPSWAHVVSKCLANAVLALLNAGVILIVGPLLIDADPPSGPRAWGLLGLALALTVAICTALGLAIGRWQPSARAASGIVLPMTLVLQFVSGIFFPLSQMPSWLIVPVSVLPVRWSAQLMREAFLPASFAASEPAGTWETGRALSILAVWLVLAVGLAIAITRRDTVDR